jgi:hypothetical protein
MHTKNSQHSKYTRKGYNREDTFFKAYRLFFSITTISYLTLNCPTQKPLLAALHSTWNFLSNQVQVAHPVMKFPAEGSLLCSEEPVSGPYPELDESSPHPTQLGSILVSSYVFCVVSSLHVFRPNSVWMSHCLHVSYASYSYSFNGITQIKHAKGAHTPSTETGAGFETSKGK